MAMMKMTCEQCQVEMVSRRTTAEQPYRYALSGLPGVRLINITVWVCPRCHAESPVVPRLGELHEVIADILVRKSGRLRGDEIRFLRKQVGLQAQRFAALLGISPAHLSRVEHGHARLGTSADKVVRIVVARATDTETGRQAIARLADELFEQRKRAKTVFPSAFRLQRKGQGKGWKPVVVQGGKRRAA